MREAGREREGGGEGGREGEREAGRQREREGGNKGTRECAATNNPAPGARRHDYPKFPAPSHPRVLPL